MMQIQVGSLFIVAALAGLPLQAAEKSELIRLKHIAPGDAMHVLENASGSSPVSGQATTYPLRGAAGIIPRGISAWTVDLGERGLHVTGTRDGISELKKLIRLVDIPAERVRLSVLQVDMKDPELHRWRSALGESGEGTFARMTLDDAGRVQVVSVTSQGQGAFAGMVTAQQVKELERLPARSRVTAPVANTRQLRIRQGEAGDANVSLFSIQPRINGDRTVTLLVGEQLQQKSPVDPLAAQTVLLRRLEVGQGLLRIPKHAGTAILVVVQRVEGTRKR